MDLIPILAHSEFPAFPGIRLSFFPKNSVVSDLKKGGALFYLPLYLPLYLPFIYPSPTSL